MPPCLLPGWRDDLVIVHVKRLLHIGLYVWNCALFSDALLDYSERVWLFFFGKERFPSPPRALPIRRKEILFQAWQEKN